jgi:hypothetical protein
MLGFSGWPAGYLGTPKFVRLAVLGLGAGHVDQGRFVQWIEDLCPTDASPWKNVRGHLGRGHIVMASWELCWNLSSIYGG